MSVKKYCLCLLLPLMLRSMIHAQDAPAAYKDSLRAKVTALINQGDDQQAIKLLHQGLPLAAHRSDPDAIAFIYYGLGYCFLDLGQSDSAVHFSSLAYSIAKTTGNKGDRLKILNSLLFAFRNAGLRDSVSKYVGLLEKMLPGLDDDALISQATGALATYYFDEGNFARSIDYDLKCIAADTRRKDTLAIITGLENLGSTLLAIHNPGQSLKYFTEAQQLLSHQDNPHYASSNLYYLAEAYYQFNNFDSSLYYANLAIPLLEEDDNLDFLASTRITYAKVKIAQKDFNAAIAAANDAIAISRENDLQIDLTEALNALGLAQYSLSRYQRAWASYNEALNTAAMIHDPQSEKDAYDGLAKTAFALGRFKEAYLYSQSHLHLQDSLGSVEIASRINELETQYQNEKKQHQIELLSKQNNIQALQLQSRERLLLFSVISVILLIVLLVIAYRSYQLRQRTRLLSVRNRIARDLHDDVGASLSGIRLYSEALRSGTPSDSLLEKISETSKEVVEHMSDIVWAINPKNDSFQNMTERMQSFALQMGAAGNLKMNFDFSLDEATRLPMEMRKNIFLIFKEAVNNAVKYSAGTLISIGLTTRDHRLTMRISDDGKGFDKSAANQGNGLRNMKLRADEIDGEVTIDSLPAVNGTTVTLSVRLP